MTGSDMLRISIAGPETMANEVMAAACWWEAALLATRRKVYLEETQALVAAGYTPADEAEGKIVALGRLLRERLPAYLAEHGWGDALAREESAYRGRDRILAVDYEPQGFLWELGKEAGLPWSDWDGDWRENNHAWPGKTTMRIDPGKVIVKCGHGANFQPVYMVGHWRFETYARSTHWMHGPDPKWWDGGHHLGEAKARAQLAEDLAQNAEFVVRYGSLPITLARLTAPDGTVTVAYRAEDITDEEVAAALAKPLG